MLAYWACCIHALTIHYTDVLLAVCITRLRYTGQYDESSGQKGAGPAYSFVKVRYISVVVSPSHAG